MLCTSYLRVSSVVRLLRSEETYYTDKRLTTAKQKCEESSA